MVVGLGVSLANCWPVAALRFLSRHLPQGSHLLHHSQQVRESPCKTEIAVLCDTLTNVAFDHSCCILLVETKSYVPLTLKGGEGITQRHEHEDGRSQGPPKGAWKGLSTGTDTYRYSVSAASGDSVDGEMTVPQKRSSKRLWGLFRLGILLLILRIKGAFIISA